MGRNLKSAINLLAQHHPGQLMRKGHGRHGESHFPLLLDTIMQAKGTANDKADGALPIEGRFLNGAAELLGREHPSLDAKGKQAVLSGGLQ